MRSCRYHNIAPYLIVFFIATLFFVISSIYPYEIGSDAASQIKSIQQWLRGESKLFNFLVVPSTTDLSQDVQFWITSFPPGVPIFFMPLIASGLSLGIAAKLTAYMLFILGCFGWIKLADKVQAEFPVKIIFSLMLSLYSITVGGVTFLWGDVLPFGIMPWLFLYTLYVDRCFQSGNKTHRLIIINCYLLGMLLGLTFWIKYSASLVSLGLLLYLAISSLFFRSNYSFRKRFLLLAICMVSFLSLVFILSLLNKHLNGIVSPTFDCTVFGCRRYEDFIRMRKSLSVTGPNILISLLGSPGLALSQSQGWLSHIIFYSDRIFPFFRSLDFDQRTILFAIAGIPGTLIFFWLLLYSIKIFGKRIFIFACCITFVPFTLIGYVSNRVGSNQLISFGYRYVPSFFVFTQILLIGALYRIFSHIHKAKIRVFISFVFVVFFIVPSLFYLFNFIKNGIVERLGSEYITTENRIYVPTLSTTDVKSMVDKINSVIKSSRDVIVLATIDCFGASSEPWLEIKQRSLPLTYELSDFSFIRGLEGANLTSSRMFTTSKDLRVVIVISKTLKKYEELLLRLKQRFPQAKNWFSLSDPMDSNALISIWYSDLEVS